MRTLWLGLLMGCATTGSVQGPDALVEQVAQALRDGDAATLHRLAGEESSELSEDDIARLLEENREELAERADQLDAQRQQGVQSRATVRLPGGELAVLTLEGGQWKIVGGVIDAPTLQTPLDTVRSLRRALARRSFRGVLRVLAHGPRAEIDAEIERFLEDTEDELDLEAEVRGNEAFVRSSNGRVIHLVREAGEWRVADIE